MILLIVMFTGHLFIPEGPDSFDEVIGVNWSAKYSTSSLNFVANGLYTNPLLDTPSYSHIHSQYDVHSRHITVVFNIFVLMQIFNFLNCRKNKDKMINIIEGMEIQTAILFTLTILAHFLFMLLAGSIVGFYPNPLTPSQWLLSIGIAASVWLISFLAKLLPE